MLRSALACLIVCLTTGCASIVNGQNQSVSVVTRAEGVDVAGATCTLSNDKGKWFTATPGSVIVRRSYGELAVACTHQAHEAGAQSFKSATKAMAFGNAVFGGVIGVAVDVSTGAAYDYPDMLSITLGTALAPAPGGAAPAPVAVKALPTPPRTGTRYVLRELDAFSGATLGESVLTLTALSATEAEFNDGTIISGLNGQPTRRPTSSGPLVGIRVADLLPNSRASASFVPPAGGDPVAVELNVGSVETLPDALGALRVARAQVVGYAGRAGNGSATNAPITGDVLVDLDTGLLLGAHIKSRSHSYTLRRELVKVTRPAASAASPA